MSRITYDLDEAQMIMLFPMSLSGVAQFEARRGGLLTALASRPPPQPMPPHLGWTFTVLTIKIRVVNLGQPSVTTNPLPAHTTHSVSPPSSGIHHMDFVQDNVIHMLSWDDGLSEMIVPNDGYEIVMTRSGRIAQLHLQLLDHLVSPVRPIGQWLYLNVCPLATIVALDFAPSDFGPSTQTAGAIPSSLHQKVKFIHDGQDFCRDFVAMSFDQHSSTLVLDMMRGMSFLLGFGGLEIQPRVEEMGVKDSTMDELQHMLHQMQMGDETLAYMIDGVVPHDEYHDEMDMLDSVFDDVSLLAPYSPTSQILDIDDETTQHDSNEKATPISHYQQAATTLFHDMMHRDVEVYVDDMIVKSHDRADICSSREILLRIRKFKLRLNPKKCIFGVSSGKLLGYMVSERGIEVILIRLESYLTCLPKTEKESRFSRQIVVYQSLHYQIDRYIRPLILYLSVSDIALGCMLAQLDDSRSKLSTI
ncbi:hypothetical protein CK203_037949 [Vitis vinifera]|uniref:Reverse transcriptase domain-containing protein n=1 Tax=Vitis vinifera TaxID=29760 RepID=A0A438HNS7_VITVI|nr:hypothetical protein CK203_037949 [Vitis vinifera]